jgi:hypothetical protein
MGGQVVLLAQQHLQATPRRVAGDPGAIDAAANDEKIVRLPLGHPVPFRVMGYKYPDTSFSTKPTSHGAGAGSFACSAGWQNICPGT